MFSMTHLSPGIAAVRCGAQSLGGCGSYGADATVLAW